MANDRKAGAALRAASFRTLVRCAELSVLPDVFHTQHGKVLTLHRVLCGVRTGEAVLLSVFINKTGGPDVRISGVTTADVEPFEVTLPLWDAVDFLREVGWLSEDGEAPAAMHS